jgi:hypothetical protein
MGVALQHRPFIIAPPHATCDVTHGYDFNGNDLLGPNGRPAPQNCSAGPGACCDMVRPPAARRYQTLRPSLRPSRIFTRGVMIRHGIERGQLCIAAVRQQAGRLGSKGQVLGMVVEPGRQDVLDEDQPREQTKPQRRHQRSGCPGALHLGP